MLDLVFIGFIAVFIPYSVTSLRCIIYRNCYHYRVNLRL